MNTATRNNPNGRQRRSARLTQAVAIEIAGKGADGTVFVESTRTCEISRYGASLTTRSPFPIGSPMAIRRTGGKPIRARVVSATPSPEPGLHKVGVEFVTEESYWDCEFPREWQDSYAPVAAEEQPAAARERLGALDAALEAVVRKAETVRAQAETMLVECAGQIEAARQQSASALASQLDTLAARKKSLEEDFAGQARAAAEAIRAQEEHARASLTQQAAGLEQKVAEIGRQIELAIQAGREKYRQALAEEAQKASQITEQAAAQLETHRRTIAELEAQAARWREQTAASLDQARQEAERLLQSARSEVRAAALCSIQEFRKRIPELEQEASRLFASMLAEQKTGMSRWIAQSLETVRAGFTELENNFRGSLAEHARQALQQYNASFEERWKEARTVSEAITGALEARLQRARNALRELGDWSERTITGTREKLQAAATEAEAGLREATARHLGELNEGTGQGLQRLQQQSESLQATATEASRRLDQSARELQELSVHLDRNAKQKRQEMDALFASLMERYDHRKRALDRLLETLEGGRAALRADLESLRTCTEENQARLERFTAEQEAALKSKTVELEKRMQAAVLALEGDLHERAAAALQSLYSVFSGSLEQGAAHARQKFLQALEVEAQTATTRVSELLSVLDRRAEDQAKALEAAAAGHVSRLDAARQDAEAKVAAGLENLYQRLADGEAELKQAAAAAVGAVEDCQAKAASAAAETLAGIQQARTALGRESAEWENQARQRRQSLEAQFATLSSGLEEKRATLDVFYSYTDQAKADLAQSVAGLDRRVEEARSALHLVQHEIQDVLDKRAEALAVQLRQKLEESLNACQQELVAMGEAAQGVFQVRLRSLTDETVAAAAKLMGQAGDVCAGGLTRAIENLRQEQERRMQDLSQQCEESFREQRRLLQDSASAAAGSLNEQIQQMTRLAVERVREAHELLLRETPARVTEAQLAFRQSLERIVEQAREDTAAAMAALSSQWVARSELEIRRRLYEAIQSPNPPAAKSFGEVP